jgi:hypothetical protein
MDEILALTVTHSL